MVRQVEEEAEVPEHTEEERLAEEKKAEETLKQWIAEEEAEAEEERKKLQEEEDVNYEKEAEEWNASHVDYVAHMKKYQPKMDAYIEKWGKYDDGVCDYDP